jgi:hypothetical protein
MISRTVLMLGMVVLFGCGSVDNTPPSMPTLSRMVMVEGPYDFGDERNQATILRDRNSGQEYLFVDGTSSICIQPLVMKNKEPKP